MTWLSVIWDVFSSVKADISLYMGSLLLCVKKILPVLLGIGIVWTPMITQRRKSDVFSFTLSKCLKENIAVDLEKKKEDTIYTFYYVALQHMVEFNIDYTKKQI